MGGRFAREHEGPREITVANQGTVEQEAVFAAGALVGVQVGAPRPRQCRPFVRKRMAEVMPTLVAMLLKEAHAGSLGHLKMLVQLAGLDKGEVSPKVQRREKSLEKILLEQWEKDAALAKEEAEEPDAGLEETLETEDSRMEPWPV